MKILLILTILTGIPAVVAAQIELCEEISPVEGWVDIHSSDQLDSLLSQRLMENERKEGMSGYRLQIYFGTSKDEAMKARTEFLKEFSDEEAYINYEKPYFTIRVGDFRDRFEAQRMLRDVREEYPGAIVVADKKVQFPPLRSSR
ncbi:MAG: SPOR domain-containing protein [Bacteroidia bacterium]